MGEINVVRLESYIALYVESEAYEYYSNKQDFLFCPFVFIPYEQRVDFSRPILDEDVRSLSFKVSAQRRLRILDFYWDVTENYKVKKGSFVDNYYNDYPILDYSSYSYDYHTENRWEELRFSGSLLEKYIPSLHQLLLDSKIVGTLEYFSFEV